MSFNDAQNSSKHTPLDKNYLPENSTIVTPCQIQGTIRDKKKKKGENIVPTLDNQQFPAYSIRKLNSAGAIFPLIPPTGIISSFTL